MFVPLAETVAGLSAVTVRVLLGYEVLAPCRLEHLQIGACVIRVQDSGVGLDAFAVSTVLAWHALITHSSRNAVSSRVVLLSIAVVFSCYSPAGFGSSTSSAT